MKKAIWFLPNVIKKVKVNRAGAVAFENLERYDWILFTSKNTVRFFVAEMRARGVKMPAAVRIAAVGPETARALKSAGLKISLMPKKFSAEHLVSALGKKISGKRILFPRSAVAAPNPVQRLRSNGARVDVIHLYATIPARIPAAVASAIKKGTADYIVFTSPSAVASFVDFIKKTPRTALEDISAVCIGPSTAFAARAFPFKKIHTAESSTKKGIARLLRELP